MLFVQLTDKHVQFYLSYYLSKLSLGLRNILGQKCEIMLKTIIFPTLPAVFGLKITRKL